MLRLSVGVGSAGTMAGYRTMPLQARQGTVVAAHLPLDQDVTLSRGVYALDSSRARAAGPIVPVQLVARKPARTVAAGPEPAQGYQHVPTKLRFLPTKANFKLGNRLGTGTVGVVYQASSPEIGRPVAVKLLHPSLSSDKQIVKRFEREVMIMERLAHPHIVRHYGGGMMDGQYFYAMELLNHGSLKDRIKQEGRLSWEQVAAYGAQIASALQHAHNHGVIHRDLKPSNLFFADDGRLILGDFGIALDVEEADLSDQGMTVGTYLYMSPEQICADHDISGKADIYSLGCVMYEMLTGHPPFSGVNFSQIWDQHLHADPQGIVDQGVNCPLWLERLVLQMLAKKPEDRPFSARAVQGVLREHLLETFGSDIGQLTDLRPAVHPEREVNRTWLLWLVFGAIAAAIAVANVAGW